MNETTYLGTILRYDPEARRGQFHADGCGDVPFGPDTLCLGPLVEGCEAKLVRQTRFDGRVKDMIVVEPPEAGPPLWFHDAFAVDAADLDAAVSAFEQAGKMRFRPVFELGERLAAQHFHTLRSSTMRVPAAALARHVADARTLLEDAFDRDQAPLDALAQKARSTETVEVARWGWERVESRIETVRRMAATHSSFGIEMHRSDLIDGLRVIDGDTEPLDQQADRYRFETPPQEGDMHPMVPLDVHRMVGDVVRFLIGPFAASFGLGDAFSDLRAVDAYRRSTSIDWTPADMGPAEVWGRERTTSAPDVVQNDLWTLDPWVPAQRFLRADGAAPEFIELYRPDTLGLGDTNGPVHIATGQDLARFVRGLEGAQVELREDAASERFEAARARLVEGANEALAAGRGLVAWVDLGI